MFGFWDEATLPCKLYLSFNYLTGKFWQTIYFLRQIYKVCVQFKFSKNKLALNFRPYPELTLGIKVSLLIWWKYLGRKDKSNTFFRVMAPVQCSSCPKRCLPKTWWFPFSNFYTPKILQILCGCTSSFILLEGIVDLFRIRTQTCHLIGMQGN